MGYGQESAGRGKGTRTRKLSRGQMFELDDRLAEANERLERLGYIEPIPEGTVPSKCDDCGAEFIAAGYRDGHVRTFHPERARKRKVRDAAAEEARIEREEKQLLREAPLHLEKRAAVQTA